MPETEWMVRIISVLASLLQGYVGVRVIQIGITAHREARRQNRPDDLDGWVSAMAYGAGRVALGVGVLTVTIRPLPWLIVGAVLLMFVGPPIARRIVRRFWLPPGRSIAGH